MICKIIWRVLAPIEYPVSIRPGGSDWRTLSTSLAKKGVAPTVNGTIAALIPMLVPTISLVNGIIATSKMINGMERKILIRADKILFNLIFGFIRDDEYSNIPKGKPRSTANRVLKNTI